MRAEKRSFLLFFLLCGSGMVRTTGEGLVQQHLITLLTDFGTKDAFVGIMKGVILGINPTATLVDLSHEVPPQDVVAGALILRSAAAFFPPSTVHVAVVDPGVGSERRAL